MYKILHKSLPPPTGNSQASIPNLNPTKEAINGIKSSPEVAQIRPISIMIENHPDSRPQSGLSEADVVYEVLAEGGITRFEALYQTNVAKYIGPVRSARDYFAQIADEWGAIYAHVGGSNEVIQEIKDGVYTRISDANQYYNGDYFERITSRAAPHNVYTSIDQLRKLATDHKFNLQGSFESWLFKDDSARSSAATYISMSFSTSEFDVNYTFDGASNTYKRFMAGAPHADAATGKQILAKSVVVQLVDVTEVPNDPLKHVNIDMTGGGKAYVFEDGGITAGTWAKTNSRTIFYDSTGNEIKFNRGPLWLELVPSDKENDLKWH